MSIGINDWGNTESDGLTFDVSDTEFSVGTAVVVVVGGAHTDTGLVVNGGGGGGGGIKIESFGVTAVEALTSGSEEVVVVEIDVVVVVVAVVGRIIL